MLSTNRCLHNNLLCVIVLICQKILWFYSSCLKIWCLVYSFKKKGERFQNCVSKNVVIERKESRGIIIRI